MKVPEGLEQKAGTPAQDDGDGAQAQTGTPARDGGDAGETVEQELARLREERKLALAWKEKAERTNQLEAELERMREQPAASYSPPPTGDPLAQQQQQEWIALQNAMQQAQLAAMNGDYVAQLALANLKQQAAMHQQLMLETQLSVIPESDRATVRKELQSGRYADAQAAHDAVVGRRLRSREEALAKQQKELEEVATKRAAGVVGTGRPVPVTAAEMRQTSFTPDEFAREYDKLAAEDPAKARTFAARFNRGEMRIAGG